MLIESTYDRYILTLDQQTYARFITIVVNGYSVTLNNLLFDNGGGFKPFNPLLIEVDGAAATLPTTLNAGTHVIELQSIPFEGIAIALMGLGMNNLMSVSLSNDSIAPTTGEVYNETPDGLINGTNNYFTTEFSFIPGSTRLYLNTTRMVLGVDYIESLGDTVIFTQSPLVGDTIRIDYSKL